MVQLDPRVFDSEEAVNALQQCLPGQDDAEALKCYVNEGAWVSLFGCQHCRFKG